MNRIILIGNGFDLAHGLKTSYPDFINDFWREEHEKYKNKDNWKTISNWEEATHYIYEDEFIMAKPCMPRNSIIQNVEDFKRSSIYKNKFLEYIQKKIWLKNWCDIEEFYYKQLIYCKSQYLNPDEDAILDAPIIKLNEDFREMKLRFEKYLTEAYSNKTEIKDKIGEVKTKILQHIDSKTNQVKIKDTLFLTFNYTKTLEDIYKKRKEDIVYIHGELNDKKNQVIFGYGDEVSAEYKTFENLNENAFLENIKSSRYADTDNYVRLNKFIEDGKYEVFIFGHSCGTSDRTLLNELFENDNCVQIKCFYYKMDDGRDDFNEKIKNISRCFNDKQKFRKRIIDKSHSIPLFEKKSEFQLDNLEMYKFDDCGFEMGDDNAEEYGFKNSKNHKVKLSKFEISTTPVTQKQWFDIMGLTAKQQKEKVNNDVTLLWEDDRFPINFVNWYDAVEFCNRLSEKYNYIKYYNINGQYVNTLTRKQVEELISKGVQVGFRLPTEAEWEYAAKHCRIDGEETVHFAGCDSESDLEKYAWYENNSDKKIHAVGSTLNANELKIYDMSGNVMEWCEDWYMSYGNQPEIVLNPVCAEKQAARVLRGGSWLNIPNMSRVIYRHYYEPSTRYSTTGIRLVRSY